MAMLDAELEDLRLIINCPRLYISNFFSEIRAEIDLAFSRQLFSAVQLNPSQCQQDNKITWQRTIKRLDAYEMECLNNQKKLKFKTELTDEINRYIDLIGSRLARQKNADSDSNQTNRNLNEQTESSDKQTGSGTNRLVVEYELKPKEKDPLRDLVRKVTLKLERILFMNRIVFFKKISTQIGRLICIKNQYVSKQMRLFLKNEELSSVNQNISNELLKSAYLNELIKTNADDELVEHKPTLNEIKFECSSTFSSAGHEFATNEIPADIFNGGFASTLTDIDLSNNQIISIDASVFAHCKTLKFIDLSFNQLTCLNSRLFSGLQSLIILNLSHNELTYIDKTLFTGLKSLETINLSNNHLTKFDGKLINELACLEEVYLYNNLITGIDFSYGPSKLRTINVSNNLVNSLPNSCFAGLHQLRYVGLACNVLSRLESKIFAGLAKVETIDLAGNRINHIDDDVFRGLTCLNKVDLSYNELKEINTELFKGLTNLKRIYLPNNKINIDQKLMLNIEKSVEFVSFKNQSQNDIKLIV